MFTKITMDVTPVLHIAQGRDFTEQEAKNIFNALWKAHPTIKSIQMSNRNVIIELYLVDEFSHQEFCEVKEFLMLRASNSLLNAFLNYPS